MIRRIYPTSGQAPFVCFQCGTRKVYGYFLEGFGPASDGVGYVCDHCLVMARRNLLTPNADDAARRNEVDHA